MKVAMEKEIEIKKIEQDLSTTLTQMKDKRSEVKQCEKEIEETLKVIKEKCSAESDKLNELIQQFQKLSSEIPQLVTQYCSLFSDRINKQEIKTMSDIEEYGQMWKKYNDELHNFLNGK